MSVDYLLLGICIYNVKLKMAEQESNWASFREVGLLLVNIEMSGTIVNDIVKILLSGLY